MEQGSQWVDRAFVVTGLVLCVGMLGAALFGKDGFEDLHSMQEKRQELEVEIAHLRVQRDHLREEVLRLRVDPRTIERLARDKGMVKPGETVFLLPTVLPPDVEDEVPGGGASLPDGGRRETR